MPSGGHSPPYIADRHAEAGRDVGQGGAVWERREVDGHRYGREMHPRTAGLGGARPEGNGNGV
jgi:hypothetical protein